jgi:hypothetical protein
MLASVLFTKPTKESMMAKFRVLASETVFYEFVVEADSLEEAQARIDIGDYDTGPAYDGDNFEIDSIEQEQTA